MRAFLFDEYWVDCEVRGLMEVTIRGYKNQLGYFSEHYEFTQEGVNKFILDSRQIGRHTATINSYLIAIRAYMKWAGIDANIKLLKKDDVVKEVYTEDEIRKLIVKPKSTNFLELRTWALVCFLIGSGCRISTALEIRVEDVDLAAGMIIFRHMKNHTQQYFPVSKSLKSVLMQYLSIRGKEGYLFCNQWGDKADLRTVQGQIVKYNNSRGVKLTSAHAFRRTFVSNYLRKGGDLFRLQKLIGWKSLEMVNKYARLYAEDYGKGLDELCLLDNCTREKIKLTNNRM